MPTVDMDYIARWPFMRCNIAHGATHADWLVGLQNFISTYQHCMDKDVYTKEGSLRFPPNFTCAVYSNLDCCYAQGGSYVGWNKETLEELRNLAKMMQHFRAPIYVCSAESERCNMDDSFDEAVLRAKTVLIDFPEIMVCSGQAFWNAIRRFAHPEYPMHHYDVGWSCKLALGQRAASCSRLLCHLCPAF